MNNNEFKSRNGDTLTDLSRRQQTASDRRTDARAALCSAEAQLQPLRDAEQAASYEHMNISSRINTWWNEYRTAAKERIGRVKVGRVTPCAPGGERKGNVRAARSGVRRPTK